ncbi:MAG: hypothetical protein ACOH2Q_08770 [Rhodococcus sp. (in: high G+C Gram-positive bacteria)]
MSERTSDHNSGAAVQPKRPEWVRTWCSVHLGWLMAFVVLFAVLTATIATFVLLFETLDSDVLLSMVWLAFVLLMPLALAVSISGLGSARLSRFVRPVDVAAVGPGVAVPGRGAILYRSGIVLLALLLGVSYVQRGDEPVRPGRHQVRMEILSHFGAPIALLFFALSVLVVKQTRISLHPDGIVQEIYRRRAWRVTRDITVVPWSGIVDLHAQTHPDPAVSHPHWYPTVRVVYRDADKESDQVLVLMACEKKVEPNSLLALLQWCRDNPWVREQLARDDARELLRPPRLLERIRADRAAATSGGEEPVR